MTTLGISIGGVSCLATLAYLLWSDRNKLLEEAHPRIGVTALARRLVLYIVTSATMAGAAYLAVGSMPDVTKPANSPSPAKLELVCIQKPQGTPVTHQFLNCESTSPHLPVVSTGQAGQKADNSADMSGNLTLALTALGIFVALVTAISLAVAKNATDEARRAEAKIDTLRTEADYISQAQSLAVGMELGRVVIDTVLNIGRSSILQSKFGIYPSPLLEAKLNVLEEMQRWNEAEFDAEALDGKIDVLLATMDNPTYVPHLKAFFDGKDVSACSAFIALLRKPLGGVLRADHERAASSVGKLLRKLRKV